MLTPNHMLEPNFLIELNDFVYPTKESSNAKFTISNVKEPVKIRFLDREKHLSKKGVYVIFSPDVTDFDTIGKGCIYVGQGNLRDRLYSHKYYERFGKEEDEFIVIFYEIEDEVDRKAVERILIKHYDPSYNKEGESKIERVRKDSDFSKRLRKVIYEIEEIYGEKSCNGKRYSEVIDFTTVVVDLLQDGFDLEDIEFELIKYNSREHDLPRLSDFLFRG